MVGVPRSKGCHLCVKRRVKCDETKPHCHTCVRYGAPCPGYDRASKFVTEKHQVRPRQRGRAAAKKNATRPVWEASSSSPAWSTASSSSVDAEAAGSSSPDTQLIVAPTDSWSTAPTGLPSPVTKVPVVSRSQFICTMLDTLYATSSRGEITFLNPWFDGIQAHIGHKATLDSAATSLIMHLIGKSTGDSRLIGESRSLYGHSLMAIQKALNHATEWSSSETLCATTILCLFELFAGTTNSVSWMDHAKGVSYLIQQRGPNRFNDPWEQAIFRNFRPLVIMNSLFSGEDCFLAQTRWQRLMKELSDSHTAWAVECNPPVAGRLLITDSYFCLLAKIPGILRRGYPLREGKRRRLPVDKSDVEQLGQHATEVGREFLQWSQLLGGDFFPEPTEIPSKDPRSPFPVVLNYENTWYGSLYMGYWASMLIVQECLLNCQIQTLSGIPLEESIQEMANNILRSMETVGVGIMGGYRVGYAIRIVYEFVDLPKQLWIQALLDEHGKTYAGLKSESFPSPSLQEDGIVTS